MRFIKMMFSDGLPTCCASPLFCTPTCATTEIVTPNTQLAVAHLKRWLFSHIMHPYPTEDEKEVLAYVSVL